MLRGSCASLLASDRPSYVVASTYLHRWMPATAGLPGIAVGSQAYGVTKLEPPGQFLGQVPVAASNRHPDKQADNDAADAASAGADCDQWQRHAIDYRLNS